MQFLSAFFAVAALGFALEAMGLFAHELNTAAAAALLLISAALDPSLKRSSRPARPLGLCAGLAAAVGGFCLLPMGLSGRFFAAALWFWGLDRVAAARGGPGGTNASFSLACVLFGIYQLAVRDSLLGWYGLQDASRGLSSVLARVSGEPVSLGATFNALDAFVLCVLVWLCGWWGGAFRRPLRFAAGLVGIAAAYAGYLLLFAKTPAWLPQTAPLAQGASLPELLDSVNRLEGQELFFQAALAKLFPLHMSWIAVVALALILAWCLRRAPARPHWERLRGWELIAAPAALLAVWCFTNTPAPARSGLKVALHKEGFLNWMVPEHKTYGSRSAGMFGNMPLLLDCFGWQSELIDRITPETLTGKDLLVIINQKDELPAASVELIREFVLQGGALLVLGDHTFAKDQGQMWLDQPLQASDIKFHFDSADYFLGGWLHSLTYAPSQMTAGLGDATNEAGCVVGASLNISHPAAPIIVGRYGYSDAGDEKDKTRGYLGDMNPNPGELLGDVVLVAAQNVGRGRVLVVGDTSGFVNAIQTQTWPFVVRAFHWLAGRGAAAVPAWRDMLGLALLAVVAAACLPYWRTGSIALPAAAAAFVLATSVSTWVLQHVNAPPPLTGKVALVDLSHVGRFSLEGWRDNAVNGVYLNLMRKAPDTWPAQSGGYFTFGLHDFDEEQIRASRVFVTIAPTRPYSAGELAVLREFMEQGGTVLLAVGWEDRAGSQSLLDMGEIELLHRPLGRFPAPAPAPGIEATFWDGWALRGGETLLTLGHPGADPAASAQPVVVRKKFGRGQLVVIGDSDFLLNKNLEVEDGAILSNVRFFQWLLGNVLPPEAP